MTVLALVDLMKSEITTGNSILSFRLLITIHDDSRTRGGWRLLAQMISLRAEVRLITDLILWISKRAYVYAHEY